MKRQTVLLTIPILAALLFQGGLYSYGFLLTGAVTAICLFIRQYENRKQKSTPALQGKIKYLLALLPVAAILSMLTAVDRGLDFLGLIHVLVILFWIYYLLFWRSEEKEEALMLLPWAGAGMVILCVICGLIPSLKSLVWQADRLGGFFQYSNTCGLFLLMGIYVLLSVYKEDRKSVPLLLILMTGIFLTGSRGSILLLVLILLWNAVRRRTYLKSSLISFLVLLAGGGIYAVISGNFQNLGRIFTLAGKSSTIYGRLLYMADALPVILRHPLGLGYMGYSQMQMSFQTGVYTTVFVHNDWLQMILDYGWIFFLAALLLLIFQIFKGNQPAWQREMLLLIAVYSLVEFHMQYLSIVMIMLLLFDFPVQEVKTDHRRHISRKGAYTESIVMTIAGLTLFSYFGIASLCTNMKNYELALSLYPGDTYALEGLMNAASDEETAVELANRRLEINDYSNAAKNILVYAAASDGDYADALKEKLSLIAATPYASAEYEDFESLAEEIETIAEQTNDQDLQEECRKMVENEQTILKTARENQNPLADHIRDQLP